ncbi:TPA: hypothetical protein ACHVCJ_000915 [Streptococcus suis]|nr:hypothetical protein [Streptococcus suis]
MAVYLPTLLIPYRQYYRLPVLHVVTCPMDFFSWSPRNKKVTIEARAKKFESEVSSLTAS